jgi:mannosyltransferase OCH1-like enzyme
MQKIIHNIWIQGYYNLPDKIKENHMEIKKLNPGWEFIIWDDKMIIDLLEKYPKILSIYKHIDKYSGIISNEVAKNHLARYVILKEYGGIYYDLEFECITSFDELFNFSEKENENTNNKNAKIKNTIYVASSKIEFLDYIYPFNKPKYCACFIGIERENLLMEKVIQNVLTANNKYELCNALDKTLQNNENKYNIVLVNKVSGYYQCSKKNSGCFISDKNSSVWYMFILHFFNCNYKQILLVVLIFLIMFGVDKISKYNSLYQMNQGQNNLLFPFGSLHSQSQQSQPQQSQVMKIKSENRKKKLK